MTDDTKNTLPDLTDMEEVRKAIIANEILKPKFESLKVCGFECFSNDLKQHQTKLLKTK